MKRINAACLMVAASALSCAGESEKASTDAESIEACTLDFADAGSREVVLFRDDVLPIFGLSCTASDCHDETEPKAALDLGPHCRFDTATKRCEYDDPDERPLTDSLVQGIREGLLLASRTVPAVARIEPFYPARSFLIQKITATHRNFGHECIAQDGNTDDPCGDEMPLGYALCKHANGLEKLTTIEGWVRQGALYAP